MHSLDTRLNTDNVVVLTPDGKLCLSLVKQTYETFGIEAIKRTKADMKHDKHIVMIDLKKDRFKPGSKEFNRLEWCLKNTLTCQFKMVFCATDILTGAMVDMEWSMSNITYIEKKEMTAEFDTLTDINIPSFSDLMHDVNTPVEHWDTRANEALEWLGLAHMKASRIKKNDQIDPFVSVYQTPASLLDSQIGTLIHFKGLLPTTNIHNIMTIVRKLMVSGVTSEWASITCWGYQDSPFTWSQMGPHYHYLNGENDYTFLLLPNKTAYVYQLLGSHHVTK
ncbi:ribonuclease P [Gilbertella persicaria]|uniref:ribonuclease P n=1 Tax=Gilbertella persicaria TaxID=101096 RepID=UPI0022201055|nr:ribonuclease P [Gilbertella persicaria]KAI8072184.1 ribonuclease P [Gilbertella persicaria]